MTAAWLLALLLADADASALATKPTPGPLPALHVAKPQRLTLANGLTVLAVPRRTAPLVVAALVVPAGAALDPPAQAGLAAATADMLDEGAGARGPLELAADLETLGAQVSSSAGRDGAQVILEGPARTFPAALALASDLVVAPRFDEAEWKRVKNDRLTALLQRRDQPGAVAGLVADRLVYGEANPYGRPVEGYTRTVETIERADLVRFHGERWRPGGATLIVSGDFDPAGLRPLLERTFGRWQAAPRAAKKAPAPAKAPPPAALPRLVLVDRPGAPQTVLRVIGPGPARRSPERPPLVLASTVLGGTFMSRLNARLREEKGYTYGASAGFRFLREAGAFQAGADVFTKVTDAALKDTLDALALIRKEPITAAELAKAQAIQQARLAENLSTTGGTASLLADAAQAGEPPDAPERFARALHQQTTRKVLTATARHLFPDRLSIVVVGDRAAIEAPLRALGLPAPEIRDTDGDRVGQ
jgi:zinc protease